MYDYINMLECVTRDNSRAILYSMVIVEGFELCGVQWRRAINHGSACTRGRALLSW